jgi:hypothetical protein
MGSRDRFADKDLSFDDFMSRMGVTPIPEKSQPVSRRGRSSPPPQPTPAQRSTKQHDAAREAFARPASSRPTAGALVGRVEELEQQLSAARSSLAAEQDARVRVTAQLREAESVRDQAVGQSESLQHQLEQLQLQLGHLKRRLRGDEAPAPQLESVLELRGVKGPDEAAFLIRGLLETRQLRGLLEQLQAEDPESLRAWLEDRVALVCEAHRELAPTGRAPLLVPPRRCEACGGTDIKRAIRLFIDAALINGMTRLTIVGGAAKHHRMLRELVEHRALRLQLAPNLASRTPSQIRSDLENSDAVIVWTRGELSEHVAQYSDGGAKIIVCEQESIARMLAEAAERMQR